jgi:ATP-dependent exoDNAse (exonuclease V) beta subunit
MTVTAPADQPSRDVAVSDFTRNLCVDAGAGTGKTKILVDRALNALLGRGKGVADRPRPGIDQLLIITFTEKAASELRDRLRKEILTELSKANPADEDCLLKALRGLDSAHIETIHSFASGILRERPDALGLDPNFEQLDELGDDLELERAWEQWFGQALEDRRPGLRSALNLGMKVEQIGQLARALHRQRDLLDLEFGSEPPVEVFAWKSRHLDRVARLTDYAGRNCTNTSDSLFQLVVEIERESQLLAQLQEEHSIGRYAIQMTAGSRKPRSVGNKSGWPDDTLKQAREIAIELRGELELVQARLRTQALHGALVDVGEFVRDFAEQRREEGKLNFHDLLLFARDCVRNDSAVRRYFRDKFRYILVDEFQDTDPLQVELIAFLAEKPDSAPAMDWRRVELEPGKVFIVGDPKQSIYRFRRADISVYEEAREQIAGAGARLSITQNFRSEESVLTWVNGCFSNLIVAHPGTQPEYEAITADPRRGHPQGKLPHVWALYPADGKFRQPNVNERGMADARRTAEAEAVAGLITKSIDGGRTKVLEGSGDTLTERRVELRDFAILTRTRTGLEIWEEVFRRAGIGYRVEGGRQFFRKSEFLDLLNILTAIDDPTNEVALLGALRSPAFGFSDDELAIFYASGGRWDYLYRQQPQEPPEARGISDALVRLRALHDARHSEALPAFVDRVLREFKLIEFSLVLHHGEQRVANLLKVVEQARALWERERMSLRSFTRWLSEREDERAWEREYGLSDADDNVVQFLTIHAAKGLEFPVVVLADLAGEIGGGDSVKLLADRARGLLGVHVGKKDEGFSSASYPALLSSEKAHETAERYRLLYVAATRARDYLVLPVYGEKGFGDCLRPFLPAAQNQSILEKHGRTEKDVTILLDDQCQPVLNEPEVVRLEPVDELAAQAAEEQRHAWLEEKKGLFAEDGPALAGGRVYTATALKEVDKEYLAAGAWEDERGGRAGRTFGIAFHDAVERLPFDAGPAQIEAAAEAACAGSLAGRRDEMAALITSAWKSEVVARAAAAGDRCWRELDFTLSIADGVMDGRIDLVFEEGGRFVAVDYKTDTLTGDQVEARGEVYRQQAAVYAAALERLTGRPTDEVWLYFVRLDQALRVTDLRVDPQFVATP